MFTWKMSAVQGILSIFIRDCKDMRKLLTIAAILLTASLSAQEAPAAKENNHRHALEFTTGYPGFFMLFEYGLGVESLSGQKADRHFQHGLNIGYTFSWGKRWELNTLLNIEPLNISPFGATGRFSASESPLFTEFAFLSLSVSFLE